MNRLWFAVIFIVTAFAVCLYEQAYTENFCREIDSKASLAIQALNENDNEKFYKCIKDMDELWKKKNDTVYSVNNHVLVDELSFKINSAYGRKETVYEIKAVAYAIRENNKIKLSNIL